MTAGEEVSISQDGQSAPAGIVDGDLGMLAVLQGEVDRGPRVAGVRVDAVDTERRKIHGGRTGHGAAHAVRTDQDSAGIVFRQTGRAFGQREVLGGRIAKRGRCREIIIDGLERFDTLGPVTFRIPIEITAGNRDVTGQTLGGAFERQAGVVRDKSVAGGNV